MEFNMSINLNDLFPGKPKEIRKLVENVFKRFGTRKQSAKYKDFNEKPVIYHIIAMSDGRYFKFLMNGDRIYLHKKSGEVLKKIYVPHEDDCEKYEEGEE